MVASTVFSTASRRFVGDLAISLRLPRAGILPAP
jgi:hypothetical protein